MLITLLVAAVSAFGLQTVLTRMFFHEDGPRLCRQLILSGTFLAIGAVIVIEILSPLWIPLLGHVEYPLALHVAVWSAIPGSVTGLSQAYLRARERATAFVVLALVSSLGGQLLGILLLILIPGANVVVYLAGVGGGWLAAAAIGLGTIRPERNGWASRATLREGLRLGIPVVPHNIAWTLLALGDRAVIQRIDGSYAVARYQIAYTTGALALTAVTSAASAWMPIVYGVEDDERRWRVHADTYLAVQIVAAFLAGALTLVGPPLLSVATPSTYLEARLGGVIALVAVSAFPWTIYAGGMQLLLWRGQTRSLAWITPVAAVLNVLLVVVLLPPLGLSGAALATLIAYGVLAYLVRRAVPRDVPMRSFTVPIVRAWLAAGVLVLVGVFMPATDAWVAPRLVIAALATVGFVIPVLKLVRDESSITA
jgi:O-antigen/teichoic acid export membrane protein